MNTNTLESRGPLSVEHPPDDSSHLAICAADGSEVARVHVGDDCAAALDLAHVMASAPELLGFLKQVLDTDDLSPNHPRRKMAVELARTGVERAEGLTPPQRFWRY